jgi:Domain of unknown function (DUF1825)
MSNFFDSELIQEELQEINHLQDEIYYTVMDFGILSREQKLEHIEKLKVLLEKQRIMYTRLCLTDDPEARELKKRIQDSIVLMGFSPETDMNSFFESVSKTIESLKKNIDD